MPKQEHIAQEDAIGILCNEETPTEFFECQECGNNNEKTLLIDLCMNCKTNFIIEPDKLEKVKQHKENIVDEGRR